MASRESTESPDKILSNHSTKSGSISSRDSIKSLQNIRNYRRNTVEYLGKIKLNF